MNKILILILAGSLSSYTITSAAEPISSQSLVNTAMQKDFSIAPLVQQATLSGTLLRNIRSPQFYAGCALVAGLYLATPMYWGYSPKQYVKKHACLKATGVTNPIGWTNCKSRLRKMILSTHEHIKNTQFNFLKRKAFDTVAIKAERGTTYTATIKDRPDSYPTIKIWLTPHQIKYDKKGSYRKLSADETVNTTADKKTFTYPVFSETWLSTQSKQLYDKLTATTNIIDKLLQLPMNKLFNKLDAWVSYKPMDHKNMNNNWKSIMHNYEPQTTPKKRRKQPKDLIEQ